MRKSMKHAHLDGIQRTKTLVQDKYGWYKPTAQRQQKTVLSKDIEAQNAKTIEKTKKKKKQYSRGLGIGALPKECVNIVVFVFFGFFNVFLDERNLWTVNG